MTTRTKWLGFFGLLFLVLAALWLPLGVPQLQRLPAGIDDTMHYQGTMVSNVDLATGAPLAAPVTLPLKVDRHLQSLGTGADNATVKETLTITIGSKVESKVTTATLDRRSMKIEGRDPATYWIDLPFDTSSNKTYEMWKPETNTSYPLQRSPGARQTKVDGLALNRMSGSMPATPVGEEELRSLAAQGFPMQLTSQQVSDRLKGAGIDLVKTSAALQKALTPQQMSGVLVAMTSPVPLQYTWASSGDALIEHRSGMVVSVTGVHETLAVRPNLSGSAPLVDVLKPHATVPEIGKLLTVLDGMGKAPAQTIYSLHYSQTPASITERVGAAKDAVRMLGFVRTALPGGLAVLGVLFLGIAAFTNRRTAPPAAEPQRLPRPEVPPDVRRAA